MALTAQQKTTWLADIAANTNTTPEVPGVQIKDLTPTNSDHALAIANWYNAVNDTAYWVWDTAVSRSRLYTTVSDLPSSWDWGTFKSQTVQEHDTWREMFMGDSADFNKLNTRAGANEIFKGTAPNNAQRAHIFAVARRLSKRIEKLFGIAQAADVATGNDGVAGNRGKTTNPDGLGFIGSVSATELTG